VSRMPVLPISAYVTINLIFGFMFSPFCNFLWYKITNFTNTVQVFSFEMQTFFISPFGKLFFLKTKNKFALYWNVPYFCTKKFDGKH